MNPYSLIINILRGKHEESLREKLKNHDFSIISQNCWGGGWCTTCLVCQCCLLQ